jgi:hypothetical protein
MLVACVATACARPASAVPPAVSPEAVTDPDEPQRFANKCTEASKPVGADCTLGPGTDKDVRRVAEERLGAIRGCYEAALSRVGRRRGRLTVAWRITSHGTIDCVNVIEDPMRDETFRSCVGGLFADASHDPLYPCGAIAQWKYGLTPPE